MISRATALRAELQRLKRDSESGYHSATASSGSVAVSEVPLARLGKLCVKEIHIPQRDTCCFRLCFEEATTDRMHRYSIRFSIESREQPNNFVPALLPEKEGSKHYPFRCSVKAMSVSYQVAKRLAIDGAGLFRLPSLKVISKGSGCLPWSELYT